MSKTTNHRIFTTSFASIYPLYIAKAEKKGWTKSEVDTVICWLTGYRQHELDAQLKKQTDFATFFSEAPDMNPARTLIKGVVCGVRVEDIEEPTMREIRYLDKLIDELAKGKPMEKILKADPITKENAMNPLDPKLDLSFERIVEVPKELIWKAWTTPEHLMPWFCPLPWKTVECEIDLHPGGRFYTVMQSPEGQQFPNEGCYLEVIENERLTWTNALLPGFRPGAAVAQTESSVDFKFSATIQLQSHGTGTRYTAIARHADEAGRNQHAAMGFEKGWGIALDQLVAHSKKM